MYFYEINLKNLRNKKPWKLVPCSEVTTGIQEIDGSEGGDEDTLLIYFLNVKALGYFLKVKVTAVVDTVGQRRKINNYSKSQFSLEEGP